MEAPSEQLDGVWSALEAYLAAEQLELDDLELVGRARARTLRVLIDGERLDLDRIAEVSRGVSRLLDSLDESFLTGSYQLEVSSPGLERKLTRPRHFAKSIGREVIVKTSDGQRRGLLTAATEGTISIDEAGTPVELSLHDIRSARTVFTLTKAPKPGQRSN
jgi:ribosome maturation factor RimP